MKSWLIAAGIAAFHLICFSSRPIQAQTTIHVPADQPTIQAGIDAAKNGDTILVAPGTYKQNIDFKGKAITVTSGATSYSGAASTIISAAEQGPTVTFSTNEPPGAVLNGFTIQDAYVLGRGTPSPGAGIFIVGASPTITNNLVTKNICGIVVTSAGSPLIQGNDLNGNTVVNPARPDQDTLCETPTLNGSAGAAVSLIEVGNTRLIGNVLENNIGHVFVGESYVGSGVGGIYIDYGAQILLENNTFRNNSGNGFAAFDVSNLKLLMVQNLFEDFGFEIESSLFFGSTSPLTSALTQVNNTIYTGDDIEPFFGPLVIANGIMMIPPGNPDNDSPYGALTCGYNPTVLDHSDAYWDNGPATEGCQSAAATGELAVAAQFVNPSAGDFHELPTSPTVAAGDINAPNLPATDLDGKNRTVCGEVDMGVYQLHPSPPIALSSTPNPSVGGTTVTISAALTGNCNVPTGTLSFFDGSNLLGTSTLDGTAKASFATAALTVGKHNITATYPGDFNFNPSTSNTVVQVVTGYPSSTTLTVAPNPSAALQAITLSAIVSSQFGAPTGTVSFYAGTTLLATATLNGNDVASSTIDTLVPGTYSITAVYNASTQFAGSTSNTVVEIVTGDPTTTTLAVQPNPAYVGQTVTMVATVAANGSQAGGSQAPSGSVTFYDGTAVLGTAALVASQTSSAATFTTSSLAAGTHPLTASFASGTVFVGSASQTVDEVVLASNFAIALSPASMTIHLGGHGVTTVELQSVGEFAGPLTLSYGAPPAKGSISIAPGTVTLAAGGAGAATLTMNTLEVQASAELRPSDRRGLPTYLALAVLILIPSAARVPRSGLRGLRGLFLCAVAVLVMQGITGCGSSFHTLDGVAPGTYQIPIMATNASGDTRTATLTVVVLAK